LDIILARTFLEVVATGSFLIASERLHVTQTAVSARIRTLEDQLGRRLFIRNKSGARLTPAGEQFRRFATTLVQVWERARQQVALPPGRADIVGIGGELSLWSPLMADWLIWMRKHCPDVALRADIDLPDRLLNRLQDGSLDVAVLYGPPARADLITELVSEEKLILVTTSRDGSYEPENYIQVDWGTRFKTNVESAFPELATPSVSVSLGPLALSYLLSVGGAGYFRLTAVQPFLADKRLTRVADAPEFSYSVHAVYSSRGDGDVLERVRKGLRVCAGKQDPEWKSPSKRRVKAPRVKPRKARTF
jgi:DNA-binding transcriptional LysR family regulator